MRSSFNIFCISLILLFSCKDYKDRFNTYIECNCKFEDNDSCYIDIKNFFKTDYDTMYVFGEYTRVEGINLILGVKDYEDRNFMMPTGFLVEDSHNKIILLKNHKVVFDKDVKTPYFYNDGVKVEKNGKFDGELYKHYAKMFLSSKFLIIRKKDQTGKFYYVYQNILNDSLLLP